MADITAKQSIESQNTEKETPEEEALETGVSDESTNKNQNTNNESEGENVEEIKQFIEDQAKCILDAKTVYDTTDKEKPTEFTELETEVGNGKENKTENDKKEEDFTMPVKDEVTPDKEETMEVATSVMNMMMILNQSEAQTSEKRDVKLGPKPKLNEKITGNNSMALSVGSKVEAKDFAEFWHPAQIAEVDYEEMEVLVHYEDATKRHDEWISVSSPRLRPRGSKPPPKPSTPTPAEPLIHIKTEPVSPVIIKDEPKEKPKSPFEVGERCLCRWRDNRRFIATVSIDLGDGTYEIIFDDGVKWTCNISRLSKITDASKDPLTVDTSVLATISCTPSPVYGPGPSNANSTGTPTTPVTPTLPFNTHLFDPTRDYLSSKSERREMKRKINIKEIFNIGQKKKKVEMPKAPVKPSTPKEKTHTPKEKPPTLKEKPPTLKEKPPTLKEKPHTPKDKPPTPKQKTPTPKAIKEKKQNIVVKKKEADVKKDIPDAVASIIGTSPKVDVKTEIKEEKKSEGDQEIEVKSIKDIKMDVDDASSETLSAPESHEMKNEYDTIFQIEEEAKLEKFDEQDDGKHEETLDRMKEVINKLEDGINAAEVKAEELVKTEDKEVDAKTVVEKTTGKTKEKHLKKLKKVKKVKLKREKKVKKQVEKVKSELAEMKKQVEEMRKKMSEQMTKKHTEMPESFLLPGEWCCKWVNGQPVGMVSEIEHDTKVDINNKTVLPRRSVQVEDKRLPPGWTKHMVRRSLGHSAGKWDVVLMSPENRRFHTKTDMKHYLEHNIDEVLKAHEPALMDFGIHLKLSRRMGWYKTTPSGLPPAPLPAGTLSTTSPLIKKKHLSLKLKVPAKYRYENYMSSADGALPGASGATDVSLENMPSEDGCVYVGSLKVQILENLLRCPAEGCYKNFRNNTLLKMHIKHYHRELRKMLGATPKVLDLAYARTRPTANEMRRLKRKAQQKKFRGKIPRPPKRHLQLKQEFSDIQREIKTEVTTAVKVEAPKLPKIPRSQDSPKLRNMLLVKPVKRPKVLLPVRKAEPNETVVSGAEDMKEDEEINVDDEEVIESKPIVEVPEMNILDFETAISTHTVTKPTDIRRVGDKKKIFASISKASEDEEWYGMNSDVETRSSYPRSGTPDSKMDQKLVSSESNEEQKEPNYMYSETGERIKIVHMKREEIINCHCGFREEDGLMVQCELCLCWQHALCHNIQRESEVPEKYTCSICLNPRRGRRSQRFLHDQDRMYEGLLPGAKPCESLRRSHELSGNLHRIEDALHALRVKYHVATKKDHPKLYLWAKDWEVGEIALTQEKLNSDYSDLSIMISSIGKENLPVKTEDMKDIQLDIKTPPEELDAERSSRDNQLGSQALLSGLLSSPGGASLDLPITTTELEKLAKTVQAEQLTPRVIIPQPEAAIENSACRERLLRHIQRCQALVDARLDSIEAQVAELESQDPSFEDDETADFFPRTKQTIQMMMRDLDTMEELGVIT